MADLVSVVIPTYNRAHCLPRAVESALGQTHRNVEVIVVDDGSTDDTGATIRRRFQGDRRVRILRQANAGVASARNTALAAVTGDYVAFLDSDDWWQPWKLALQLSALRAFPRAGMVWSEMEAVDPTGFVTHARYLRSYYGAYRWFPRLTDLFPEQCALEKGVAAYSGDIYSAMIMGNLVHTSTALLTRERLDRVGGFDTALALSGEDYDFHLRTCREGPVAFVDAATIRYQVGTSDRLTRYSRAMATNFLSTITKATERDRAHINLPPRMLRAVFADAHRWLAEVMAAEGSRLDARRHYAKSLLFQPWQPRTMAQLALCTLPPELAEAMRDAWHALHGAVRS